ncbi:MAG: branched-chain amino acid ABC transporter substrate-binding protein [Burkholderiales bacterium]|nr:branched-chain amino acid ABC transporter substrate-binding protein [Burkholderiales bacterium]
MTRSRHVGTGTVAVAARLVLSGCSEEKKPVAQAADLEIRIGHVAPLTGSIAHLGKDNEQGALLAIQEANATRITIGGRPARFVLVPEDDQADPKTGTTVAQKLVDSKVAGVVGHLNSGTSIPASAVYNGAGIPMISGSATNPQLTEQGFKAVFRVVGRDDQQGPAIASYLAASARPKLVAIIDDATAYGEGLANEVEKTLKAAHVQVLPREKGDDRRSDWKAVLTKIKGRRPDAVFYGGMDATGGPLLKQARELAIKSVFAFGDGACTDKMQELAGEAADGLLCSQAGIPPAAASKKFLDAYKARFKADPILYAPFTYDATLLLVEAIRKADSPDPAKYLPVLQKIEYAGATGRISFDDKGDRKDAEMTIFTMKGGKLAPIAIIKQGQTIKFEDFMAQAGAAAPAPAAQAPAAAGDGKK